MYKRQVVYKGKFRLHHICLIMAGNDSPVKGVAVLNQPGYKVLKPVLETKGAGPGDGQTGGLDGSLAGSLDGSLAGRLA